MSQEPQPSTVDVSVTVPAGWRCGMQLPAAWQQLTCHAEAVFSSWMFLPLLLPSSGHLCRTLVPCWCTLASFLFFLFVVFFSLCDLWQHLKFYVAFISTSDSTRCQADIPLEPLLWQHWVCRVRDNLSSVSTTSGNQKCITLVYLSLISCPLESLELLNDRDDSIWFERVPGFLCASVPAVCCRVEKAKDGFGF